jgi:hypothetical protein
MKRWVVLSGFLTVLGAGVTAILFCRSASLPNDGESGPIIRRKERLDATFKYTLRALSRDEAAREFPNWALPPSAHDIQVATYHEWLAGLYFFRVEGTVPECVQFAEATLARNCRSDGEASRLRSLEGVTGLIYDPAPLKTPWFRPQDIVNGLVGGGEYPTVWVDLDRGIVYFQKRL